MKTYHGHKPEQLKHHEDTGKNGHRRLAEASGGGSGAPKLELYQKESCSFSHAVRARLSELGLDFVAHSVPEHHDLKHMQLVRVGGKDRIPFLIDHGTGMKLYGSAPIISYLELEYGEPPGGPVMKFVKDVNRVLRDRSDQLSWAIRMPVERVVRIPRDIGEVFDTARKSVGMIRDIFVDALAGPPLKVAKG